MAATEHGDQFNRYQNWAAGQNPPVACFLVGLDGARKDVPETSVSKVTLPVLFRSWCNSTDCHVAWLASPAADLFEQWSNEEDGIIGHATSRVVPYLITRSLAVDMAARSAELGGAELVVEASKTSAGRPMIVA